MRDKRKVELSLFTRKHYRVEERLLDFVSQDASGVGDDSRCRRSRGVEDDVGYYRWGLVPRRKVRSLLTEGTLTHLARTCTRESGDSLCGSGTGLAELIGIDPMEKVCKNCDHFVQVSSDFSRHFWGDERPKGRAVECALGVLTAMGALAAPVISMKTVVQAEKRSFKHLTRVARRPILRPNEQILRHLLIAAGISCIMSSLQVILFCFLIDSENPFWSGAEWLQRG